MSSSKIIGCGMLLILCLISASMAHEELQDTQPLNDDEEELFENVQELLSGIQSILEHGNETVSENAKLSCSCRGLRCQCCHRVRVRLRRIRFNENCCLSVEYLRRNIGFRASLTCGNKIRLSHEISLRKPKDFCLGVPGLKKIASICLQLYNLNIQRNRVHGCARVYAKLLFIKVINVRLGCFNINFLDQAAEQESDLEPTSYEPSYWIPPQQDTAAAMPVYEEDVVTMEDIEQTF